MLYFYLKMLHVCLAAVILGVGIGMVARVICSRRAGDVVVLHNTIRQYLLVSACVILPAILLQMLLGFSLVGLMHYSVYSLWVRCSLICYVGFLLSWLASHYALIRFKYESDLSSVQQSNKAAWPSYWPVWKAGLLFSLAFVSLMVFMMSNRIQ
jgi:uncharacterized membrane protein